MKQPNYQQIFEFATQLKTNEATLTDQELRDKLLAQFVPNKDSLQNFKAGLVADPIGDHINLLRLIFHSLRKIFTQDRAKLMAIQDKIDRAIAELSTVR